MLDDDAHAFTKCAAAASPSASIFAGSIGDDDDDSDGASIFAATVVDFATSRDAHPLARPRIETSPIAITVVFIVGKTAAARDVPSWKSLKSGRRRQGSALRAQSAFGTWTHETALEARVGLERERAAWYPKWDR